MATESDVHDAATDTDHGDGDPIQIGVALLFGAVLAVVGVIAPVLGGAESELLGVFGRNYLHDAVHVASGLGGLVAGYAAGGAMAGNYNKLLGGVYVLVFVLGAVALSMGLTPITELINLNWADNVLHLAVGVVLVGVGFGLSKR